MCFLRHAQSVVVAGRNIDRRSRPCDVVIFPQMSSIIPRGIVIFPLNHIVYSQNCNELLQEKIPKWNYELIVSSRWYGPIINHYVAHFDNGMGNIYALLSMQLFICVGMYVGRRWKWVFYISSTYSAQRISNYIVHVCIRLKNINIGTLMRRSNILFIYCIRGGSITRSAAFCSVDWQTPKLDPPLIFSGLLLIIFENVPIEHAYYLSKF